MVVLVFNGFVMVMCLVIWLLLVLINVFVCLFGGDLYKMSDEMIDEEVCDIVVSY